MSEASGVGIGESFIGEAAGAAHPKVVLGDRRGPVGTAWATALATPGTGQAPCFEALDQVVPVTAP